MSFYTFITSFFVWGVTTFMVLTVLALAAYGLYVLYERTGMQVRDMGTFLARYRTTLSKYAAILHRRFLA